MWGEFEGERPDECFSDKKNLEVILFEKRRATPCFLCVNDVFIFIYASHNDERERERDDDDDEENNLLIIIIRSSNREK